MESKFSSGRVRPLRDTGTDTLGVHRFEVCAMNTVFEILTTHPDAYYAHQAAHEAFIILKHLEHDVSRFISNSDISRINMSPGRLVIISESTAQCLSAAQTMEDKTLGRFNIALGHLVDRYKNGAGPDIKEPPSSKKHLDLDTDRFLAGIKDNDALIDLGGIAKGFAIDKMAELLTDWNIETALIHGGRSTVYARGNFGDAKGWPVSITNPFNEQDHPEVCHLSGALSASGMDKGAHIINPRTLTPVTAGQAAWAMAHSATEADALSTAFMCMSDEEIQTCCAENPGIGGLKYRKNTDRTETHYFGTWEPAEA